MTNTEAFTHESLFIGTANWGIPSRLKDKFPQTETLNQLQKYAQVFHAVEIGTSFYKDHKAETYHRWADSVPDHFGFSVKLSRVFTHERRLGDVTGLDTCCKNIAALGNKWKVLLIQLPSNLIFQKQEVEIFFKHLRQIYAGSVVLEPKHLSWVDEPARELLHIYNIDKVFADPEPCPLPQSKHFYEQKKFYLRLEGFSDSYKGNYTLMEIEQIAQKLMENPHAESWCVFDNMSDGYATENALQLLNLLNENESLSAEKYLSTEREQASYF